MLPTMGPLGRATILLAATVQVVLSGCQNKPEPSFPTLADGRKIFASSNSPGGTSGKTGAVFVVRLRMATIELPFGSVTNSQTVWSGLDEKPVHQTEPGILARNGIRMAVGGGEKWPQLAEALTELSGRPLPHQIMHTVPGRPFHIPLGRHPDGQTIFIRYPDGTLSGDDYPPSYNALAVLCTLDAARTSGMRITLVPQVHSLHREVHFRKGSKRFGVSKDQAIYGFPPLQCRTPVPANGFLLIGPGAGATQPTSVGHRFLCYQTDGIKFETVLVLMPQVLTQTIKASSSPLQVVP